MEIIGHKKIAIALLRAKEKNSLEQAYLFSGPESLGKFSLALDLAEKISGERKDGNLLIVSPEIEEKKGTFKKKDIKIESARRIQKYLSTTSFQGGTKIVIIDEAERLTLSAQNALLKILEEPPKNSVIFLITSDQQKIIPTILSRCQIKKFHPVSKEELEKIIPVGKDREEIIFWSLGRPGIAKALIESSEELEKRREAFRELRKATSENANGRIMLAEKLFKDEVVLVEKLKWWSILVRENWSGDGNKNFLSLSASLKFLEKIEQALYSIRETNANTRLILEDLLISI